MQRNTVFSSKTSKCIDVFCPSEHTDGDIIAMQLATFEGENGMNVNVYTKEKCWACGSAFNRQFKCPKHPKSRPTKVFLQVTGVVGQREGRIKLYTNREGEALTIVNASAFKKQIEKEIARDIFNPKHYLPANRGKLKWINYATQYLADMKVRTELPKRSKEWMAKSSYDDLEKYQRLYLTPYFKEYELHEVRKGSVKKFLRTLKGVKSEELASDTIKAKCVDGIRHMLNYAIEEEDIPRGLVDFPRLEKPTKVITTLDQNQQNEIIDGLPDKHKPILRWAMLTGRRVNEYRAMLVKDINFAKGEYCVTGAFDKEERKPFPKVGNTTGAVFPLDEDMVAILSIALADRVYGPDDYVFLNKGEPYTMNALGKIFLKARKKAGYYKVELNEFGRHSWATQRLSEGWSFSQVAMFLLNSAAVVEKRYANVTRATRQAVIELHKRNFVPSLSPVCPQSENLKYKALIINILECQTGVRLPSPPPMFY